MIFLYMEMDQRAVMVCVWCCTWVHEFLGHVFNAVNLLLLRRMDHHGGGAEHAEQAAQLPV